jgi:hypothetical protein
MIKNRWKTLREDKLVVKVKDAGSAHPSLSTNKISRPSVMADEPDIKGGATIPNKR